MRAEMKVMAGPAQVTCMPRMTLMALRTPLRAGVWVERQQHAAKLADAEQCGGGGQHEAHRLLQGHSKGLEGKRVAAFSANLVSLVAHVLCVTIAAVALWSVVERTPSILLKTALKANMTIAAPAQ